MSTGILIVLAAFPDAEVARKIVRELVDLKLAACGTIVPGAESVYRWKGKIETQGEALAILKTTAQTFPLLQAKLKERHPYEVPETIAFPVSDGLPNYLAWVRENVTASSD
jgi:periplasmic divalent cation tolerance protein